MLASTLQSILGSRLRVYEDTARSSLLQVGAAGCSLFVCEGVYLAAAFTLFNWSKTSNAKVRTFLAKISQFTYQPN